MEKLSAALHVLLIGNDPIQQEILRGYLELDDRYTVREAKGIYHALALCEARWPSIDVVLIDMGMTTIDVIELVLAIRDRRPDMAILGTTDSPSDLYAEPRLRTSRAGFIPGPFSATILRRCIQAVLKSEAFERRKVPERKHLALPRVPTSRAPSAGVGWF